MVTSINYSEHPAKNITVAYVTHFLYIYKRGTTPFSHDASCGDSCNGTTSSVCVYNMLNIALILLFAQFGFCHEVREGINVD